MAKKQPKLSYAERVRRATEAFHVRIASDVTEDADTRQAARSALSVPTAEDVLAYVEERAGENRLAALRALRSYLAGTPVPAELLITMPTTPAVINQADKSEEQGDITPEPVAEQVPVPVQPVQPAKYVSPGPKVIRRIENSKYFEAPDPRDDVKKILK